MQGPLDPGLYVVATPIGNLGDITERARRVLAAVDLVVCEDTRVTGRLLHVYGINRPLLAYHDHNAQAVRPRLLARLAAGERLALVSDAGTPCLADPGFKLVRAAHEAGSPVRGVPGPSALTLALAVAGLPTDRFFFQGFLPARRQARRAVLEELRALRATLVIYETGPRLERTLKDAFEVLGPREVAVARELTKLHEEVRRGELQHLHDRLPPEPLKGEIVLIITGAPAQVPLLDDTAIDELLIRRLETMKPGRAAASLVEETGRTRGELYERALRLKGEIKP